MSFSSAQLTAVKLKRQAAQSKSLSTPVALFSGGLRLSLATSISPPIEFGKEVACRYLCWSHWKYREKMLEVYR